MFPSLSDKMLTTGFQGNRTSCPHTLQNLYQNSLRPIPPSPVPCFPMPVFHNRNPWLHYRKHFPLWCSKSLTVNTLSMPRIFFSLARISSYGDVSPSSFDPELDTSIIFEAALDPAWTSSCIMSISASVWTKGKSIPRLCCLSFIYSDWQKNILLWLYLALKLFWLQILQIICADRYFLRKQNSVI